MPLYNTLRHQLPQFNIEPVTLENLNKYETVFYSNKEYYMITDGHPATKQDCIETIEYGDNFPSGMCHCFGFSKEQQAVAFLALLEGYPEAETLYIGLFLVDESFQKKSIGTKIINTVIKEAFHFGYTALKLSCQENNVSGYPFRKKLGFVAVNKTDCDGFYNVSMELTRDI